MIGPNQFMNGNLESLCRQTTFLRTWNEHTNIPNVIIPHLATQCSTSDFGTTRNLDAQVLEAGHMLASRESIPLLSIAYMYECSLVRSVSLLLSRLVRSHSMRCLLTAGSPTESALLGR